MCGIGGILRTDGQPIPEEWLDAIDARIAYRGPDGAGRFRDRVEFMDGRGNRRVVEVAFVHRRLSIIDHKDGAQPMVSERGRNESEGLVAVVFNGCIYNHRELRRELEAKGHRFVTDHSDTEVLIHGWREWDEAVADHLEGMYAFAIWSRSSRQLFVARDLFGEKPLYYHATESVEHGQSELYTPVFAFAGDVAALQVIPAPDPVCGDCCRLQWLIPQLMYGVLADFLPGPDLIEQHSIDPASFLLFDAAARNTRQINSTSTVLQEPRVATSLDEHLEQAVARRLEADAPLGCFLSGGVDSSIIAYFAKRHKRDLKTFTVRMPDDRYDESTCAESVARHLGTDHSTLDVAMRPADDLVHLIQLLGQPFGDSSLLPSYWVSNAARQHVKVALSGDGGDEMFIGYERYLAAPFLAKHWRWLRLLPASPLHRFHPKSSLNKLARLVDMAGDLRTAGIRVLGAIFTLDQLRELDPHIADDRWKCSIDEGHSIEHGLAASGWWYPADAPDDALSALREADLHTYLPNDLLRKTDTASMACGLEVRCPFLDRDLAAAVLAMPVDELIPNGERKGLLRRIARKYLPKECVDRPKMGFAIPIGEWFRNDDLPHKGSGMKTLLLDHLNSTAPFGPIQLNRKAVLRFINEHMSGKRDHGQRLFTLLTLSIWARGTGTTVERTSRPSA